jgi:hypothetical protein
MTVTASHARTPKDLFQNGDMTTGANYSPAGAPSSANDLLISTATTALTLNAASLGAGSINVTNNSSYTISNNADGTANSTLTLGFGGTNGTSGANPADIIYLSGPTSTLTFQGPNGGDGIGTLAVSVSGGNYNFNVVQAGATLNISSSLALPFGNGGFTKTGAGTMNLSGPMSGQSATFGVAGGTANMLPGSSGGPIHLGVRNENTGPGSTVILNLFQSVTFRSLNGTIAMPSSGTNTATINLIGTGTQLSIIMGGTSSGTYDGLIAGEGSVSISGSNTTSSQSFSGNNTYTGTTTASQTVFIIDGSTSGQGDYTITGGALVPTALYGNGTIGLKANGNVTLSGPSNSSPCTLGPGRLSTLGILTVNTSGTGRVAFGNFSALAIDVSSAGVSDQLNIVGGAIDLTSGNDALTLTALPGAFDGLDYTVATFAQNLNGGIFNSVQGLPSGYVVQYNPTNIRLAAVALPLQVTSVVSRKVHGSAGAFDLPLISENAVECRASGGNHTLVFTFTNYMVSGSVAVTTGVGTVMGKPIFSGKTMTVELTGVADAQQLSVTLHNMTDRFSQTLPDTIVSFGVLAGDVSGSKSVNATDIGLVKAQSGMVAGASTFRYDVNVNGLISASDLALVKAQSGLVIP